MWTGRWGTGSNIEVREVGNRGKYWGQGGGEQGKYRDREAGNYS